MTAEIQDPTVGRRVALHVPVSRHEHLLTAVLPVTVIVAMAARAANRNRDRNRQDHATSARTTKQAYDRLERRIADYQQKVIEEAEK